MNLRIGVVTSVFNEEITSKLEEGAISFLESFEGAEIEVWAVRVPGAIEIPLACKALFERGCDGVVTCGAVIRGDTSHYDLVCNSVERGVTQLMLEVGKPIGFGVITTENEEQALARAGGEHGNKGAEAAQVVVEMIGLLDSLQAAELQVQIATLPGSDVYEETDEADWANGEMDPASTKSGSKSKSAKKAKSATKARTAAKPAKKTSDKGSKKSRR